MARRVYEYDGRLWVVDDTHPQTNGQSAVCRAFIPTSAEMDGVVRGYLDHTAVLDWTELVRAQFLGTVTFAGSLPL